MSDFEIKVYSQKELRELYGVGRSCFGRWLKTVPGLYRTGKKYRTFSPAQVKLIIDHLGEP